ncbi:MAG TPA: tetratricopeptide repeat protein [Spongiibacteraceae bacterium]|nr:tetratricopeptide repeat protein [Spongiibacteraceae bacterium]
MKRALCLMLAGGVSACSWFGGGGQAPVGPTLAELPAAPVEAAAETAAPLPIADIVAHYESVLAVSEDPEIEYQVRRRLAALEMRRSESAQIEAAAPQAHFQGAAAHYAALLAANPGRADNDHLLYQLSKAYDFDGQQDASLATLERLIRDYPDSPLWPEAQFRRAEILFSRQDYAGAEAGYQAVLDSAAAGSYRRSAQYMLGWSRFKRGHYRPALGAYLVVLDELAQGHSDFEALGRADRELAEDTLRVAALGFSYLEGAEAVDGLLEAKGERPYQHQLYDGLGRLYLEKKRFRDSADTYRHFVERYPDAAQAPLFNVRMIEVYEQGDFPSLVLPAKENLVGHYGVDSEFWVRHPEALAQFEPYLHQYLDELARHYHALAQTETAAAAKLAQDRKAAPGAAAEARGAARAAYLQAAVFYDDFARSFPADPATPRQVFLMAEALQEAGEWPRAVTAYERVAFDYREPQRGADAGYSAILGYQKLIADSDAEARLNWQRLKTETALRYAEVYPGDPRAVPVLAREAEELLARQDWQQAIAVADRVLDAEPPPAAALAKTAWLVRGHASFELARYTDAEQAYQSVLALLGPTDPARAELTERLAASIYRRGEQQLAAGDTRAAVAALLSVGAVAPGASIAANAQYDAATYLLEMEDWARAEQVLTGFRASYPDHPLQASVPAKLVEVHQQQGNWTAAGLELAAISAAAATPAEQGQTLYLAAESFARGGDAARAIDHYRRYVQRFPEPFELAVEARHQLAELTLAQGDIAANRQWLNAQIAAHDRAGSRATERSLALASAAAIVLADDSYARFAAVELRQPLAKSLKQKRALMDQTTTAYDKVLTYGVTDQVTQASYRLGEVQRELGRALLVSERPRDLDELALEQYQFMLEEQAYPFEERAIAIHEANIQRSREGVYDEWVRRSFAVLAQLLPARYAKTETVVAYSDTP